MVCRSFWVDILGSLRYMIMSSANRDILIVSLPICIHFISSTCISALARNSRTMLNRNGGSGHPCLLPGFSFPQLSMMLAIVWSYITLQCRGHSCYSWFS
jgi:hypothetical protein